MEAKEGPSWDPYLVPSSTKEEKECGGHGDTCQMLGASGTPGGYFLGSHCLCCCRLRHLLLLTLMPRSLSCKGESASSRLRSAAVDKSCGRNQQAESAAVETKLLAPQRGLQPKNRLRDRLLYTVSGYLSVWGVYRHAPCPLLSFVSCRLCGKLNSVADCSMLSS